MLSFNAGFHYNVFASMYTPSIQDIMVPISPPLCQDFILTELLLCAYPVISQYPLHLPSQDYQGCPNFYAFTIHSGFATCHFLMHNNPCSIFYWAICLPLVDLQEFIIQFMEATLCILHALPIVSPNLQLVFPLSCFSLNTDLNLIAIKLISIFFIACAFFLALCNSPLFSSKYF